MNAQYILALDQGTTSSRALIFNAEGAIVAIAQKEFNQIYPESGWVEHDPEEIWDSQVEVLHQVVTESKLSWDQIAAIGIANQRETTIVWDKETGEPIYNAIVWQDTRTSDYCEGLKSEGWKEYIQQNTGLIIDAYFSASKVKWILENVEGAKQRAENGELAFGTVDSWLIWKLTSGKRHCTDYSNASRTMLFNINDLEWDAKLLDLVGIPPAMLPQALASSDQFGIFQVEGASIPITAVLGDQQAALFGQACFEAGSAKNTYGTGCFMLMNIGQQPQISNSGLLTTIAWGLDGQVYYALEGSVFVAGAAVQWLRDELTLVNSAQETEEAITGIDNEHGVYFVPAFAGLGAPYWDQYARGSLFGLTRDTGKGHIIRATLESMAFQTKDVLSAMENDAGRKLNVLKVDGGAAANNFLMQFQADILNTTVERPQIIESTAMGAAYMAGIGVQMWTEKDIINNRLIDKDFNPDLPEEVRMKIYDGWKKAVDRTKTG